MNGKFLTVTEFAARAGVTSSTVYNWIKNLKKGKPSKLRKEGLRFAGVKKTPEIAESELLRLLE